MGKAIAVASVLVFLSFAFVFVQLWTRRPAGASSALRNPAPVLDSRDDGSVYALSLDIERFERRLVDEERRWLRLQADLEAARKEREEFRLAVESLQGEVRRLRRQLQERPAPPVTDDAGNNPANAPSVVPPTGETPPP